MEHDRRPGARQSVAKHIATRVLPVAAGLGSVGGMVMFVNPGSVAAALGHFDVCTLRPVFLLILLFYLLQGLRWHLLLRAVGSQGRATDHQLSTWQDRR